jgi:predicted CXXCH cytochrome family protein
VKKRIAFVVLTACVLVFAFTGVAFANFGPHGGYLADTDACAGCHRAHTSFSSTGWTDLQGATRTSALLVSGSTSMTDFCYACHGDGAPGASTNVQMGVYDSGPSGGTGTATGPTAAVFAETNSSYDATLNGGGFEKIGTAGKSVMSSHNMGALQGSLVRWGYSDPNGGVSNLSPMATFGCNDCHDPHGSSNYRLLKDQVNGVTVGGYLATGTPNPYVISNEQGFPQGGFKKGALGVADVANYVPNYTAPQYAQSPGKAMSTWCSACHTDYNVTDGSKASSTATYNYGTAEGAQIRHRHPVDVPLSVGTSLDPANRALNTPLLNDSGLPLEMGYGNVASGADHKSAVIWDARGNVTCLTCHRAHGSESTMTGWAVADIVQTSPGKYGPVKLTPGTPGFGSLGNPLGVAPNYSGAILRFDNRGVCERCHNK